MSVVTGGSYHSTQDNITSCNVWLIALESHLSGIYRMVRLNAHSTGGVWLGLALFLCLLSVLCKEQGITVVAVCLTYDLFIFHQVPCTLYMHVHAHRILSCMQHTLQSALKNLSIGGSWPRGFVVRMLILAAFTLAVMVLRLQIMHTTLPVFTM